jgi:hypothetical protein
MVTLQGSIFRLMTLTLMGTLIVAGASPSLLPAT